MKYNNKLDLMEYFQVINELIHEFYNETTYEYTPQIGEIYAMCSFFNHCVVIEDGDGINIDKPVDDVDVMYPLFRNEEFIRSFNEEIDVVNCSKVDFTFGHAYVTAKDIVKFKINDANSFANIISYSMKAIFESFKESISNMDINKIEEIARQIKDGKLTDEGILKAYENSERFKHKTEELNVSSETVIPYPQKK